MATAAAILQTLAGVGADTAEARQRNKNEALQRQQILEQIATGQQNRKVQAHQQWLEDQYLKLAQAGRTSATSRHLQEKTVTGPDGKPMLVTFDPQTGEHFDVEGHPIKNITPRATEKGVKYGAWQPPTNDSPVVGGMRMWSRDIVDPVTGAPTGQKSFGVPSTAVLLTEQHKFKQVTDLEGNTYLVPVTESSGKVVPQGGGTGGASAGGARGKSSNRLGESGVIGGTSNVPANAIPFGHKPLSVSERQKLGDVQQIEKTVNQSLALFARNPQLRNDNSPLTPALDWIQYKYLHSSPSDPIRRRLIQDAAFLSVKGAAPFTGLGRGKYILENVQKHLPLPNDSPKLFYDKLVFLKELAANARQSLLNPFTPVEQGEQVEGEVEVNGKKVKVGPQ